ncbi:MAG TPA: hypothetical protein VIZ65_01145 [Cellvibrionaceae bacterium]
MFFIFLAQAFRYAILGLTVVEFPAGAHWVSSEIADLIHESGAGEKLPEPPDTIHEQLSQCILGNELTTEQIQHLYGREEWAPKYAQEDEIILKIDGLQPDDLFSGEHLRAVVEQINEPNAQLPVLEDENAPNSTELPNEFTEIAAEQSDNAEPAAEQSPEISPAKPGKSNKKHS